MQTDFNGALPLAPKCTLSIFSKNQQLQNALHSCKRCIQQKFFAQEFPFGLLESDKPWWSWSKGIYLQWFRVCVCVCVCCAYAWAQFTTGMWRLWIRVMVWGRRIFEWCAFIFTKFVFPFFFVTCKKKNKSIEIPAKVGDPWTWFTFDSNNLTSDRTSEKKRFSD